MPQIAQPALDAITAPSRILAYHPHNEPPDFIGHRQPPPLACAEVLDDGLLTTGKPAGQDDEQQLPRLQNEIHGSPDH